MGETAVARFLAVLLLLLLLGSPVTDALQDQQGSLSVRKRESLQILKTSVRQDSPNTTSDYHLHNPNTDRSVTSDNRNLDATSDLDDAGDEEDTESGDQSWNILDGDDEELPFVDEDQVDDESETYRDDEETTSASPMEMDFFDYMESLDEYSSYGAVEEDDDDDDLSMDKEDSDFDDFLHGSPVSTALPPRAHFSTECDGDIKETRKKKKRKKKKGPPVQIMTFGKMGKGKLMSRWQKNCCIRGRRVGNAKRTFLSNNLFKECKDRTRSLRSRMSKPCKWIFWSCCEAKALRRFYFYKKSRKNDECA